MIVRMTWGALLGVTLWTHAAGAADTTLRIPPSESAAKAALNASPRHGEIIDVALAGSAPLRAWITYPERADKAGTVIVIHEIFGLTDWIRGVCDQLSADGFIAIAPDLLSGYGAGGGGTDSFPSRDDVVKAVRALTPEVVRARVSSARAYATSLPAANGKLATLGFCWGGSRSFEQAATMPAPNACVVYYGTSPDSATLARVRAPVLGLYGADDARVTSTIPAAKKALGRGFTSYEFAKAGHGFLRAQDERDGANASAARGAWPQTIAFLRKHLGR